MTCFLYLWPNVQNREKQQIITIEKLEPINVRLINDFMINQLYDWAIEYNNIENVKLTSHLAEGKLLHNFRCIQYVFYMCLQQ